MIGAIGVALIGVIVLVWAEREEDRETKKLENYRKAEALQKAKGKIQTLEYYETQA